MFRFTFAVFALLLSQLTAGYAQAPDTLTVEPTLSTTSVQSFADDPAIWIHPTDPSRSLILGTDKGTYPNGGIFVWNLDGSPQQRVSESHPNNIDVEYGLQIGGETIDIAVASMRDHDELFVYKINPETRQLEDIATAAHLPTLSSPFGLALYKRPADSKVFAFLSFRNAEESPKVQQIRLFDDGRGKVAGEQVRLIENLSDYVDGIVVDDELGYVYLAEETVGVSKYAADPAGGHQPLTVFATDDGITGKREGLALYSCADSTGYILLVSPMDRAILVYPRQGGAGGPHDHLLLTTIKDGAHSYGDGIEVANRVLNASFPHGIMVWHDEPGNRFQLYAWENIAQGALTICTKNGPATSAELGSTTQPGGFMLR